MLFDTVFVQRFEKKALLLRFYTSLFDFKLYCTDSLTWPSLIGFQFVSVPMFGGGFFGGGGGGEGRGPAGFFGQNARGNGNFKAEYDVYPVSFMGKEELEKGNKIILPQSALDRLARLNISWPMLFEMTNVATSRSTHGGVQEFSAEEGVCYFPYWMMQNLLLEVGSRVEITNTSLPKGSFVKLQPVHSDFLEIHNPRAVLENSLRNFATLTVGDCIVIDYNQRKYEIEIAEAGAGHYYYLSLSLLLLLILLLLLYYDYYYYYEY
eukprot:s5663_g3.t1